MLVIVKVKKPAQEHFVFFLLHGKMRKNNLNGASLTDVVNWVFDSDGEQVAIDNDHYFRKMETATM